MKMRGGFVSNSSAGSFVAAKAYLTDEDIKVIRRFYAEVACENGQSWNPPLEEDEYYISFDLYHIQEEFEDYCIKAGIDIDKIWFDGSDTIDHPWPPPEGCEDTILYKECE